MSPALTFSLNVSSLVAYIFMLISVAYTVFLNPNRVLLKWTTENINMLEDIFTDSTLSSSHPKYYDISQEEVLKLKIVIQNNPVGTPRRYQGFLDLLEIYWWSKVILDDVQMTNSIVISKHKGMKSQATRTQKSKIFEVEMARSERYDAAVPEQLLGATATKPYLLCALGWVVATKNGFGRSLREQIGRLRVYFIDKREPELQDDAQQATGTTMEARKLQDNTSQDAGSSPTKEQEFNDIQATTPTVEEHQECRINMKESVERKVSNGM
ncbi:hypothetical protein C8Q75DRAFT_615668 [Abortiporus biennis]|nr:hypothetical protein C8Q75DRAFT_615668 [Abortiporus biennis]